MSIGFGPDPVEQELTRVMALLDAGTFADDESSLVDHVITDTETVPGDYGTTATAEEGLWTRKGWAGHSN